jgi:hypothetical protein
MLTFKSELNLRFLMIIHAYGEFLISMGFS